MPFTSKYSPICSNQIKVKELIVLTDAFWTRYVYFLQLPFTLLDLHLTLACSFQNFLPNQAKIRCKLNVMFFYVRFHLKYSVGMTDKIGYQSKTRSSMLLRNTKKEHLLLTSNQTSLDTKISSQTTTYRVPHKIWIKLAVLLNEQNYTFICS